ALGLQNRAPPPPFSQSAAASVPLPLVPPPERRREWGEGEEGVEGKKRKPSIRRAATPLSPEPRRGAGPGSAAAATTSPSPSRHGIASPRPHSLPASSPRHQAPLRSSEDPEDPDYSDDVDYVEEKDKDNSSL
ncbi:unnamed protein product, partial [Urochloa humidicola]